MPSQLRIDPDTGRFSFDGEHVFDPDVGQKPFERHARGLKTRHRGPNATDYVLPVSTFRDRDVHVTCSFIDAQLEGFHIQFVPHMGDPRSHNTDPVVLAFQEDWLREVVGCPSGERPFGLVWNRYNIHTSCHDISIIYAR